MDDELRRLAKTESATEIARHLSGKFRVEFTRNAVIGRAHRKKIAFRSYLQAQSERYPQGGKKVRRLPRTKPDTTRDLNFRAGRHQPPKPLPRRPQALRLPPRAAPIGSSEPVRFADHRPGMCRWPVTEVHPISDFRFCGAAVHAGVMAAGNISPNPYCAEHFRMSLQRYATRTA